jgi:hypothetical protein
MRTTLMAAAVNTGWGRVFASPIYRACRRPYARIPWDRVPAIPARLAYAVVYAAEVSRARAACHATW